MTINRAEVFRLAWAFAKADLWSLRLPASCLRSLFRAALVRAWADVKLMTARRAAERPAPVRPAEEVRRDLLSWECKDSLRGSDWTRLEALRAELRVALDREALPIAA